MHKDSCQLCRFLHDPIHRALSCLTSESTPERILSRRTRRWKESISCTRFYVQDWRRIGNVSTSYPYDLVSLYWILSGDIHDSISYDPKEILNLRICWTRWRIWESSPYGWHRLDVDLTRLASDLGRTRQKYHRTVQKYLCTVHISTAYDGVLC